MKIKLFKWTIFIWSAITNENVNDYAGEYLFNKLWQKYYKGKNYLTGIRTRAYGN